MTPCRGLSRLAQYQVMLNEKSERKREEVLSPPHPKKKKEKNPGPNTAAMFHINFTNIMLCFTNKMLCRADVHATSGVTH